MATAVVKAAQAEITTCKCGKPVTFEAVPCGCRLACDKCAMKLVRLRIVSTRRAVDASPSRRRPEASAATAKSGTAACAALLAARLRRRSDSGGFRACALCFQPRSSVLDDFYRALAATA